MRRPRPDGGREPKTLGVEQGKVTPPGHFRRLCGLRPLRGVVFLIFATDLDVASSSGDPPTFDWSVLREPSLVFPSPLVFPGLPASVSCSSLAFHGFPLRSVVLLAHEDPFLGTASEQQDGGVGRARRALNKLKPHRLHKEL